MNKFKASITTLSPVHIGNGNEFDPTSYVVMDGLLLHFFPETVPLYESEKAKLMAAANRSGSEAIVSIQSFFSSESMAPRCAAASHQAVIVTKGIADEYRRRVGKRAVSGDGGLAINELDIKRTANNEHTGTYMIPGSSLKGAIRTAWLNHLLEGEQKKNVFVGNYRGKKTLSEDKLLKGKFSSDPFRLLKVSDARGTSVLGQVQFSVNRRRVKKPGKTSKGPPQRVETVAGAQNAVFNMELDLQVFDQQFKSAASRSVKKEGKQAVPDEQRSIPSIQEMFRICNLYYLKRLKEELELLRDNNYANESWETSLWRTLMQIEPQLESGEIGLLRVGRYCGSGSNTVDHIREVKINTGKVNAPAINKHGGTTIWLAASDKRDDTNLLPFGWMLLEPSDNLNAVVGDWCRDNCVDSIDRINKQRQALIIDSQQNVDIVRQEIALEKKERHQREIEKIDAEEAEAAREKDAEERLKNLTGNTRRIEELRLILEQLDDDSVQAGHEPYPAVANLLREAEEGDKWSSDEKRLLAENIGHLLFAKIKIGKKAKPKLMKRFEKLLGEL